MLMSIHYPFVGKKSDDSPIHGSAATIHGNPITNGRRCSILFSSVQKAGNSLSAVLCVRFHFPSMSIFIVLRKSFRNLLQLGGAKNFCFAKLLPMNYTRTCLVSL